MRGNLATCTLVIGRRVSPARTKRRRTPTSPWPDRQTPGIVGRWTRPLDPAVASRLKRDEHGLVAAVVQQHDTGEVLMLAWMDDEALHRTLTTGRATYWSRSRQEIWVKGETSGHRQWVRSVALDCDGDTCSCASTRTGRPATPARRPASTAATSARTTEPPA